MDEVAKNPLIRLTNIVKTYQLGGLSTTVLNEVSFEVYAGELLAIVGASGSGKSTLMNIIGLLDKADSGSYVFNGRKVATLTEDESALLRNQSIGFVFQQFNLLPRFTALDNVALPLIYRGMVTDEINEQALQALEHVGMHGYAHHKPGQLSGGQQQRVAIARALITQPEVILADEPTGALDTNTGKEVMNLFMALNKQGRTLIIITHDTMIAKACRRRITLADGAVIGECLE
jgi:putative ABC transport system ATP-binding protein